MLVDGWAGHAAGYRMLCRTAGLCRTGQDMRAGDVYREYVVSEGGDDGRVLLIR